MKYDEATARSHARYIASEIPDAFSFDKRIPLVADFSKADQAEKEKALAALADAFGNVSVTLKTGEAETETALSGANGFNFDFLIIAPLKLTERKRFDFYDFVEIMKRLRAPDGCEWDRAQTHESIRINLIEEAYELVEAIDCKNRDMMLEETGDVLMQAVFHTEIAQEEGDFGFADMLTALCRKLIDRHTHIFGENHANNAEEALAFWNEAKKKEKKYASGADAMDRVPKNLPELLYSEKIQKIAKKYGFDWKSVDGAIAKIGEETRELTDADQAHRTEEAGDLLFAVVNTLRFYKIEPEMALHEANRKFLRRFKAVEEKAAATGREMKDCSFEELDDFWNGVKSDERSAPKTDMQKNAAL